MKDVKVSVGSVLLEGKLAQDSKSWTGKLTAENMRVTGYGNKSLIIEAKDLIDQELDGNPQTVARCNPDTCKKEGYEQSADTIHSFTINPAPFSVTVTPPMQTIPKGKTKEHTITITNMSKLEDTFKVSTISDGTPGWSVSGASKNNVKVAGNGGTETGGTENVTFKVTNSNAIANIKIRVSVTARGMTKIAENLGTDADGWVSDMPDDTYSISSPVYPGKWLYDSESKIGLLSNGWTLGLGYFLGNKSIATCVVSEDLTILNEPERTINDLKLLIIGSAGLIGLDTSPSFKQKLADYVAQGGTVICFTQQHGYEFSALPVPNISTTTPNTQTTTPNISGYGWSEDQNCQSNSMYINEISAIFNGQRRTDLDVAVDGYFTNWPQDAKVLLRRTKNNMPAMIEYDYWQGQGGAAGEGDGGAAGEGEGGAGAGETKHGKIIATTLYTDWRYGAGGLTGDENILIENMIKYALAPTTPATQCLVRSQPSSDLSFSVQSSGDVLLDGQDAIFTILINNPTSTNRTIRIERDWTHVDSCRIGVYTVPANSLLTIPYTVKNVRDIYCTNMWRLWVYFYDEHNSCIIRSIGGDISAANCKMKVTTDKSEYRYNDQVKIDTELTNLNNVNYKAVVTVKITDSKNNMVFSSSQTIVITTTTYNQTFYLTMPNTVIAGSYLVNYEVNNRGEKIGAGSAYFNILETKLLTKLETMPVAFNVDNNPITFNISNTGVTSVLSTSLTTTLINPEGIEIYTDSKNFEFIDVGQNIRTDFNVPINETRVGIYKLKYVTKYDNEKIIGELLIPCSVTADLTFDQTEYYKRDSMNLCLKLINNGRISINPLIVAISIPDANFSSTQTVSLAANESKIVTSSLILPSTITQGQHNVEVKLSLANSLIKTYYFTVPDPKISISLDKLKYGTSEICKVVLANLSRPEIQFNYTMNIKGQDGTVYYEKSGLTDAIQPYSKSNIDFSIPENLTTGWYRFSVVYNELGSEKKGFCEKYIEVNSLQTTLDVTTNKNVYNIDDNVKIKTDITNSGRKIDNANLNIKVYSNNVGWTTYADIDCVSSMAQDGNYVWFGSGLHSGGKGIYKYNKVNDNWQIYTTTNSGLVNNNISSLSVDGNYLWIGTFNGISRYDKTNDTWQTYNTTTTSNGLAGDDIISIAIDGDYVWFGVWNGGVSRYDKINDTWQTYNAINSGIVVDGVFSIIVDGNYVWFGGSGGGGDNCGSNGVSRYDKINDTWQTYNAENSGIAGNSITSLSVDGNYIWFGTRGYGASRYDKANDAWQTYNTENSGIAGNNITSLSVDGNYVWFGSESSWGGGGGNNGVSKYDKINDTWQTYNAENSGLPANSVFSIMADGEKYVWFGTYSGGVSRYDKTTEWKTFHTLLDRGVVSIAVDGDNVWFSGDWFSSKSSPSGGMCKYDKINDTWRSYTTSDTGTTSSNITSMAIDGDYIWFGSGRWDDTNGIYRYNKTNNTWKTYNTANSGLTNNIVTSVAVDGDYIWFSGESDVDGNGGGVYRYNKINDTWQIYNTTNSGLVSNNINSLSIDDNYLWVGTRCNGVSRYNKINDTWQTYNTENSGIANNNITSILIDGDCVWFGSSNWGSSGVSRYNKSSNTWQTYNTTNSGLVGNDINSLSADDNYLWIGTYDGVSRYNKINNTWQTYIIPNTGIMNNSITSLLVDDDYVWFGGSAGDISRLQSKKCVWAKKTPVNITNFASIDTDIRQLNETGKFSIQSRLISSLGQVIAEDRNSFYITNSDIYLTFKTDKNAYYPGEQINITGEVVNNTELLDENNLTLTLTKNGNPVFTEIFDLQAGSSKTFTTQVVADGSFTLEGKIKDMVIKDYILVESPKVNMSFTGPDIVNYAEPFTLSTFLENKGYRPINVSVNFTNNISTITLKGGESKVIQSTFSITNDTIFSVVLTGDVKKTTQKLVKLGVVPSIALLPDPIYPEGTVEVPFTVGNTGSMNLIMSIDFNINGTTITKVCTVCANSNISNSLVLENLVAGEHMLNYKSNLISGSALVKVGKYNIVAITSMEIGEKTENKIPILVDIKNTGSNDFTGMISLDTDFYRVEEEITLATSQEKQLILNIPFVDNVSAGTYKTTVEISYNDDVICRKRKNIVLDSKFCITNVDTASTYIIGNIGSVTVRVKNTGPAQGFCDVRLNIGDIINQNKRLYLELDEEKEIPFNFTIPDDLEEKDYVCSISVLSENDTKLDDAKLDNTKLVEKIIPIHIHGYKLDSVATFDKLLYNSVETAQLTLDVFSKNALAPKVFLQIICDTFTITTDTFTITTEHTVLQFNIPVPNEDFVSKKVFWGFYLETGRALYLSTIYMNQKQKEISYYLDKQIYNVGEQVIATITPNTTGEFLITAPAYSQSLILTTTDQFNITFNLPSAMKSGTYYVNSSFVPASQPQTKIDTEYPFDVVGCSVKIKECVLDKTTYIQKQPFKIKFKLESTSVLNNILFKGWLKCNQEYRECVSTYTNIVGGENIYEFTGSIPAEAQNNVQLIYGYYLDGEDGILLASGGRTFVVEPLIIIPLTTKMLNPKNKKIINNITTISNNITSSTEVTKIEFYIDNNLGTTLDDLYELQTTYYWELNTRTIPDGVHTIKTIVNNKAFESAYDQIEVIIDNTKPTIMANIGKTVGERYVSNLSAKTINYTTTDNLDPAAVCNAYLTNLEKGTKVPVVDGAKIDSVDDGFWTLTVEATDWAGNYLSFTTAKFEVTTLDMKLSKITPARGYNNRALNVISIFGSGFINGCQIRLVKLGQADIIGSNTVITNSGQIGCGFDLTGKMTGLWDVIIETGSVNSVLKNGFEIRLPVSVTQFINSRENAKIILQNEILYAGVEILADTFADAVNMTISTTTVSSPDHPTIKTVDTITPIEITNDKGYQPSKEITITMIFDSGGVVGFDKSKFVIGRYDEINERWVALSSILYSSENKIVSKTNHLSKFAILQLVPATNLSSVKAYPNPYKPKQHPNITIDNLTETADINIYTIAGELVKKLDYSSKDGRIIWDGKNDSGYDVASGIYFVLINSSEGKKVVKLAVVR
ncbi:MAG: two-component regulator propeller domain-containing protein [Elusimicrobiota bacterium]